MNRTTLKMRLLRLGKTQTELYNEIRRRGYPNLYITSFYSFVAQRVKGPQAEGVMALAEKILEEWENNESNILET